MVNRWLHSVDHVSRAHIEAVLPEFASKSAVMSLGPEGPQSIETIPQSAPVFPESLSKSVLVPSKPPLGQY